MRGNNKYLEKVTEETDVYRRHLLYEEKLTPTQQLVFDKVNVARGWLKNGYSDSQVLDLLRKDPATGLQERRAREVLAIAYDLYADIRLTRNPDGIKLLYAEIFREAAWLAYEEAKTAFDEKDRKGGSELMKTYRALMAEAAELDGAYVEKTKDLSQKKKSSTVTIKRKSKIVNGQIQDEITQEAKVTVEK
ncbi:hypothetical protein [Siphonobacter sp. SORGH_AS_1065]|uniref:hypothetical protein n=1 Tax=Siphonobacter sp. SORGH_AS_1065 TaxID=3041795 RepID=UPI00278089D5|nr:hypothetical protein [Siphonobacter sp. SORGH_AS_1065]MDQ1085633.1 hypothetical protein [Siphonobacter sp. SORGH_AS_1065]